MFIKSIFIQLGVTGSALSDVKDSISTVSSSTSKGYTKISVNKTALVIQPYIAVAQLKGVYKVEQREKTLISKVDSSIHYPVYCCKGDVQKTKPLYKQQEKLKEKQIVVSQAQRGAIIGTLSFREISETEFKKRHGTELFIPNCTQRLEIVDRIEFAHPIDMGKQVSWPGFVSIPDAVYKKVVEQVLLCRD